MSGQKDPVADIVFVGFGKGETPPGQITFSIPSCSEILVLKQNGDIFVKGRLAENDKEVYLALREFLGDRL